jgi:hypothetical protein
MFSEASLSGQIWHVASTSSRAMAIIIPLLVGHVLLMIVIEEPFLASSEQVLPRVRFDLRSSPPYVFAHQTPLLYNFDRNGLS